MKLVVQQFTFAKHVLHKTQSLDDLPNLEVGIKGLGDVLER